MRIFLKLSQCRIILYLPGAFQTIILCSVHSILFVKYVFSAKIWFMKTSTGYMKYKWRIILLVLGYGFKSRINRHLWSWCASFSCNSMPCSGCSALHGVNLNLKKCVSLGQVAGKKGPNTPNHEQRHFERNLRLQFHVLYSLRSHPYLKTILGWSHTCFRVSEVLQ